MRQLLFFIFTVVTFPIYSQQLQIITSGKEKVSATILDEPAKIRILEQFNGRQENSLRKKWTARTFLLSDAKILIEFYDRQAVLLSGVEDFKKLDSIRFVKNKIEYLKKNISYKIELSTKEGKQIIQKENPRRLSNLKSDIPEYFDFEIYELNTGQVLFLNKTQNFESATIYENLKALSSEYYAIENLVYNSSEDEHIMKKLVSGDALWDYEPNEHMLYPKYEKELIKNHQLMLMEKKIFVDFDYYYNLYKSAKGYYVLLEDFDQRIPGRKEKIGIGTLRIYKSLEDVRAAQKQYEEFKDKGVTSEHFYQKITDRYGKRFPEFVPRLIDSLPLILNFDKEQLSFDSMGIDLVDEALKWNGTYYQLFDTWFPPVLAYYGQCYISSKRDGQWTMHFDQEDKVWIPELILKDGKPAWDWRNFYKSLAEGPIPLRWAGDWDRTIRNHPVELYNDQ